jgi:hypothetical protein
MRKLYLAGVVFGLACSSSGGSSNGTAAVDPAALDFCIQFGNEECRLAYLCVDSGSQDAAFHARFGKSQDDDCWQTVQKRCTSNQTGSDSFGPSCGPGKIVNPDSASACTDSLASESCADWTAAPAGACAAVCSTAANTGGTGGTGASTGGTGASMGGTGGNPVSLTTDTDFCNAEQSVECDRVFECFATEAAAQFGNLAGCNAFAVSSCAASEPCPAGYDAIQAAGCLAATKTATCAQLTGDPPAVCTSACLQ